MVNAISFMIGYASQGCGAYFFAKKQRKSLFFP